MDKNTITGLVIIVAMMLGFSWLNKPSEEQIQIQRQKDSISLVERTRIAEQERADKNVRLAKMEAEQEKQHKSVAGLFAQDSLTEKSLVIENNLIKLSLSTRGGIPQTIELKDYKALDYENNQDSLPLMLWNNDKSIGLNFYANNTTVNTADLNFVASTTETFLDASTKAQTVSMRLNYSDNQYIEYIYTLTPNSYIVDFNINVIGMESIIPRRTTTLDLYWNGTMAKLEKSKAFENRYTGLYYKYDKDDVDYLSATSDDEKNLETKVKWVAFKQQFFSSVLISKDAFNGVKVTSKENKDANKLKNVTTSIALPYQGKASESYNMQFYFGPNHFLTLKEYSEKDELELTKLINLGWKWVSWINRYFVIYLFNFLENALTGNYGLIILLMTLLIKLILFPLTYKSYLSSAKMRVLKPQIDEIAKKYPSKDKAMEKQKATMALYKKAGVNPMGGCLPMVVQMPVLIGLFYFFPASIELRQKSFLWATDLSSYDSIVTLPFHIPLYGDHVSLFCLLMTVTNVFYMRMNNKNQVQNDQMKGMQTMMYIMPFMFLFWFNSYAAGLSYYYFIATFITLAQTFLIRRFVNDEKLLAKLEMAKQKPKKQSKFQKKLEDLQKKAAIAQKNKK
ncbi:MAG: membrane protein insertase YidC [Marinifilaceae bacterium]